jgi:hypothetical protein
MFKIGDRVSHYENGIGTVTKVKTYLTYPVYVKWDDMFHYTDCYKEHELELVEDPIIDVDELFEGIEL